MHPAYTLELKSHYIGWFVACLQNRFTSIFIPGKGFWYFDNFAQKFIRLASEWQNHILSSLNMGQTIDQVALEVAETCNVPLQQVQRDIEKLIDSFVPERRNSLFRNEIDNSDIFDASNKEPSFICSYSAKRALGGTNVIMGFSTLSDYESYQKITFNSLSNPVEVCRCDINIRKENDSYTLEVPGLHPQANLSINTATLFAHNSLEDLAAKRICDYVILHAGSVYNNKSNKCAIFPARGNAGKSTLMTALALDGYSLINDDVLPLDESDKIISLGGTVKLRRGSWALFEAQRKQINQLPHIDNGQELLKLYLPPNVIGAKENNSVKKYNCDLIILPEFNPNKKESVKIGSVEDSLVAIVDGGSLFKKPMIKEQIEKFVTWLSSKEHFKVRYPDAKTGVKIITELMS